ncbi:MAG TPA: DUF421 domain-containing protein [Bacillus bacterium]|uniref:DUF421 domain-containing protein n=1 Tax=Siminovitchia fordii TaxID=254759 RepID=A0ABQ4K4P0_9BACI|nr:DUF421 domain-containing protein [Siminovitchia fordii]GIN20695.1 DUF421 domain-containing protein [Siminovitchia fordii]HBZ08704.1 DUF421 domain-containing protein [Bacillus sp. (in: firmicutes)]
MLYFDTVIKLVLGLGALLAVTRLLGKKEMGQFTPFDFVYALILGALLEESLYDHQISIWQMLFGVAVWAVLIYIVEILVGKNDLLRGIFKGSASRLMKDGELDLEKLKSNHIEMEQLRTMLRQQGIFSLKDVRDLYLETSGSISVKKHSSAEPPTAEILRMKVKDEAPSILLVDEGRIQEDMLKSIGKTDDWLEEQLKREGYSDIDNILYAEWSETEGFFIKTYRSLKGQS